MDSYHCLECGHTFLLKKDLQCPICKNKNENLLLKEIDTFGVNRHSAIHIMLNLKSHSAAYIKLCAIDLYNMGYYSLSSALNNLAINKLEVEAKLLQYYNDIAPKENIKYIISKAEEDTYLARRLATSNKNYPEYDILYKEEQFNLKVLKELEEELAKKKKTV